MIDRRSLPRPSRRPATRLVNAAGLTRLLLVLLAVPAILLATAVALAVASVVGPALLLLVLARRLVRAMTGQGGVRLIV